MSVVVSGASGMVGRETVAALLRTFPDVRALADDAESAQALRALGAKAAVTSLEDPETLRIVLGGAHTVCHVAGSVNAPDPEAYEAANLRPLRAVLGAARDVGVLRVVFLSAPGAAPEAEHPFLRAKGLAEEEILASGLEHAIVRSTPIYGAGGVWFAAAAAGASAEPPFALTPGSQRLDPVAVADVAAVLAAVDDRAGEVRGTFALRGPDAVTADDVAHGLLGSDAELRHPAPAEAAPALSEALGAEISVAACELFARDWVADADGDPLPDAAAEFGVPTTPFAEGLAALVRGAQRVGLER